MKLKTIHSAIETIKLFLQLPSCFIKAYKALIFNNQKDVFAYGVWLRYTILGSQKNHVWTLWRKKWHKRIRDGVYFSFMNKKLLGMRRGLYGRYLAFEYRYNILGFDFYKYVQGINIEYTLKQKISTAGVEYY